MGSVLHLLTRTRPDIALSVNLLCRNFSSPTSANMVSAKRVLRYLRGTENFALRFSNSSAEMIAAADADWAGDREDRKSTSGALINFLNTSIYWKVRKQHFVALSTTEAQYIAASGVCKVIGWLRLLLTELGVSIFGPTKLLEDNQGSIVWCKEGIPSAKHVSIRYNFVRDHMNNENIQLVYMPNADMVADALTKLLLRIKFEEHRAKLGVHS